LDVTHARASGAVHVRAGPSLHITHSCILKAYAELTGETNWYPSEVTTRAFTVDVSGLARHIGVPAGRLAGDTSARPGKDCGKVFRR